MATAWQMDGMLSPWSVEVGESRAPVPQKSRCLQRPCFIPLSRKPVSTAAEQPQPEPPPLWHNSEAVGARSVLLTDDGTLFALYAKNTRLFTAHSEQSEDISHAS